jgi:ribonuclease H2 subunit A
MEEIESQDIAQETPVKDVFIAPSIHAAPLLTGDSYTHHSPIPKAIVDDPSTQCCLGVDEAGRGPVLGPMVYGIFYLPITLEKPLLTGEHHFDDSKVLTPAVRSSLMESLCTSRSSLEKSCGWATRCMSARDIASNMLKPASAGNYNLNAQAMDATIALIQEVYDRGINVTEIYVDTIGSPAVYQKKLERVFPTAKVVVAKKADSLYPCVSAASVCAKVTRDAALEVLWRDHSKADKAMLRSSGDAEEEMKVDEEEEVAWGSGYPSDGRCTGWMRSTMDPLFGWGPECRFSWGTAKDMLEVKGGAGVKVDWPADDDDSGMRVMEYYAKGGEDDGIGSWFGRPVPDAVF